MVKVRPEFSCCTNLPDYHKGETILSPNKKCILIKDQWHMIQKSIHWKSRLKTKK